MIVRKIIVYFQLCFFVCNYAIASENINNLTILENTMYIKKSMSEDNNHDVFIDSIDNLHNESIFLNNETRKNAKRLRKDNSKKDLLFITIDSLLNLVK